MAKLPETYTPGSCEANGAFEPINGTFPAMIVESDMTPTKAGDGEYLKLTIEVLDGPHKGRKVFDNLNLDNPSAKAVEIAYQTLEAICQAVGLTKPLSDSAELHDKPMSITFAPDGAYTRVKAYKPAGSVSTVSTPKTEAARPARPWERKAS